MSFKSLARGIFVGASAVAISLTGIGNAGALEDRSLPNTGDEVAAAALPCASTAWAGPFGAFGHWMESCYIMGSPGYQVRYSYGAHTSQPVNVQVVTFENGQKRFRSFGSGENGAMTFPWGNVAHVKALRARSLGLGTMINWG